MNAASRVGEASTSVLHTIGEESEEDKETQVTSPTPTHKKSFIYRKLNYCYDNFYKVFFGNKHEYGSDFGDKKYEDEGIYEDIDPASPWGKGLDVIQEETDSEYYRGLEYCNTYIKGRPSSDRDINNVGANDNKNGDYETILLNCQGYLEKDRDTDSVDSMDKDSPKIYPKTISDKIYNFKKDFSNHDYVNVNFNNPKHDYANINLDRRTKNEILRQQFFLTNNNDKNNVNDKFTRYADKNVINDKFNKFNDKKIECHSIRNDVTKSGPDVKVAGAVNMKIFNLEKYNRVLTTTETFMEKAEASFTKNDLNIKRDDFESFVKRSEKYYTSEYRDRQTNVQLNNTTSPPKGKTEIRIVYNPTFLATQENVKGFCQFCKKYCARSSVKCCPNCVCLELELKDIWREEWLNILLILALIFVLMAIFIQWLLKNVGCHDDDVNGTCFEMAS